MSDERRAEIETADHETSVDTLVNAWGARQLAEWVLRLEREKAANALRDAHSDEGEKPKDRRLRGWWCSTCGTLTNHETAEHSVRSPQGGDHEILSKACAEGTCGCRAREGIASEGGIANPRDLAADAPPLPPQVEDHEAGIEARMAAFGAYEKALNERVSVTEAINRCADAAVAAYLSRCPSPDVEAAVREAIQAFTPRDRPWRQWVDAVAERASSRCPFPSPQDEDHEAGA